MRMLGLACRDLRQQPGQSLAAQPSDAWLLALPCLGQSWLHGGMERLLSVRRPALVKGFMQLYSVEQKRSQALEAHAAAFSTIKVLKDCKRSCMADTAGLPCTCHVHCPASRCALSAASRGTQNKPPQHCKQPVPGRSKPDWRPQPPASGV